MASTAGNRSDGAAMPSAQTVPHYLLKSPAATALALAATAGGYYLGAWLALALRYPSSVHSVLWPPNAIVLAALLLLPARLWWLVLIAVFPAHVLIEVPAGWPWPTILGLFVTNTSQAVLGASLVNRFSRRYSSAGSFVVIFIAGAVFFAPFLLSFADVGLLTLTGLTGDYGPHGGNDFCRTRRRPSSSFRRSSRRPGAADRGAARSSSDARRQFCWPPALWSSERSSCSQSPYRAAGFR